MDSKFENQRNQEYDEKVKSNINIVLNDKFDMLKRSSIRGTCNNYQFYSK